jgi:hypothetical protein
MIEPLVVGAVVVASVGLLFASYLRLPPSVDLARGLWLESAYLAETDFDYRRLVHEEPGLDKGGARNYVATVIPSLIAWLMRQADDPSDAFLWYRVLCLALSAATTAIVYRIIRRQMASWEAILFATLFVSTPVYLAQVPQLGFETPLTLMASIALLFVSQKRVLWALPFALIAASIKPTGGILLVATLLTLVSKTWENSERPFWVRVSGPALASLVVIFAILLSTVAPFQGAQFEVQNLTLYSLAVTAPDVLISVILVLSAMLVISFIRRTESTFSKDLSRYTLIQILLMIAFLRLVGYSPRYLVMILPTIVVVLAIGIPAGNIRKIVQIVAACVVCFNVVNFKGAMLPSLYSLTQSVSLAGPLAERSLEWLDEHEHDMESLAKICKENPNAFLAVSFGLGPYVATPRLGVVSSARDGVAVGFRSKLFSNVQEFDRQYPAAVKITERRPVLVIAYRFPTGFIDTTIDHEVGDDMLVYADDEKFVAYRKRWTNRIRGKAEWLDWLKAPTVVGRDASESLARRSQDAFIYGGQIQAADEAADLLKTSIPMEFRLIPLIAAIEFAKRETSNQLLELASQSLPSEPRIKSLRGAWEAKQGNMEASLRFFRSATPLSRLDSFSLLEYGRVLLGEKEVKPARQVLEACVAAKRHLAEDRYVAEAHAMLADLDWQEGNQSQAVQHWLAAIQLGSTSARQRLGIFKNHHVRQDIFEAQKQVDAIMKGSSSTTELQPAR